MKTVAWLLGAGLLIYGANLAAGWPASVAVGVLLGIFLPSTGRAVWVSLLAGMIGWGMPLLVAGMTGSVIYDLAGLLAGVMGLGKGLAPVMILLTSLVGGLLALSGAWVTGTIKAAVRPAAVQETTVRVKRAANA